MLEIEHLRRYKLEPVSLTLAAGECVAIAGPSGSGKTLLLRAIADLDPSEGRVSLFGEDRASMTGPAWRRRVGYVPAEPGWWADTVGEHFNDWDKARPLAERLGLPNDAAGWPLTRPSTGERIRLALMRALMAEPAVLMLDEPTAALDAKSVAAVESLMAQYVAQGMMVLWVSHDPQQAVRVAKRRFVMENGRMSQAS